MPIYTYQCENCGVRFERQQKFSDPSLTRCPECSKKALRKVYTPVGIVFKGSGFYATDNRSPSGASRANGSSQSESADKGSDKSSDSGDSKPSTKDTKSDKS